MVACSSVDAPPDVHYHGMSRSIVVLKPQCDLLQSRCLVLNMLSQGFVAQASLGLSLFFPYGDGRPQQKQHAASSEAPF